MHPCPCVLLCAHGPARLTRQARHCVRDVLGRPCSPRPAPFPPPPPHRRPTPSPCSAASQVLRGCQTSHARSSQDYGLGLARAARRAINPRGECGISRFSRMEIPYMHRFFDRAGSASSSRIARPAMWPSAHFDSVGTPVSLISRLNSPACTHPYPTLRRRPCGRQRMVGAVAGRYPFNVERLPLLLHAGLSRRSGNSPSPYVSNRTAAGRPSSTSRWYLSLRTAR